MRNTADDTTGGRNTYSFGTPAFIPNFRGEVAQSLVFAPVFLSTIARLFVFVCHFNVRPSLTYGF